MASLDTHVLTITEPTIKLDKLEFKSFDEGESGKESVNTSRGYDIVVSINGYLFSNSDIKNFTLSCNSIIPTIEIMLVDSQEMFSADTYPKDGDVINFVLASNENEVYKDIRIDFDIIRVSSPKTNPEKESIKGQKYIFSGRMKIPGIFAQSCKSYGKATSLDNIELIANDLKLGLATNIDSSDDSMDLLLAYNNVSDTLDDLVKHSYIDEESFQTYSIDPYYYINYVNLNQLLNAEGAFEEALAAFGEDIGDQPSQSDKGTDDGNQMKTDLILTNHQVHQGTNFFISGYSLKNNAGSKLKKNGYKRVLQYYENDSDEGLLSFDIEALSGTNQKDIEEPLKGRRDEERYLSEVKHKYVGRRHADPETSNTHLNYEFATIHNSQNLDELEKMTFEIELATCNLAIHRWQKIPVAIFHSSTRKLQVDRTVKESKEKKGFDTEVPGEEVIPQPGRVARDEFLTGYYVVGGIQYFYKESEGTVKQRLTLLRREWPSRLNNL